MIADGERPIAAEKTARRNEEITAPSVRVINQDGEQVGVLRLSEALRMAEEAGLDLVEVAPQASPPVCRVMDFGKFAFEKAKSKQEARKKQRQVQVKEVKFRPATDEGDYQVKLRNIMRFLSEGDRVKVSLRFRGREIQHRDIGDEMLAQVRRDTEPYAVIEQEPRVEGRQLIMVMMPRKKT